MMTYEDFIIKPTLYAPSMTKKDWCDWGRKNGHMIDVADMWLSYAHTGEPSSKKELFAEAKWASNHKEDMYDALKYAMVIANEKTLQPEKVVYDMDVNDIGLIWRHSGEPIGKVTDVTIKTSADENVGLTVEATMYGRRNGKMNYGNPRPNMEIKRVIFSPPATIVFWKNGDKTVVKCHNEDYDPEKGLAMAVCKRLYGDKYHRIFKDHCPEDPTPILNEITKQLNDFAKELNA